MFSSYLLIISAEAIHGYFANTVIRRMQENFSKSYESHHSSYGGINIWDAHIIHLILLAIHCVYPDSISLLVT